MRKLLIILTIMAIFGAACGDDGSTSSTTSATTTEATTTTTATTTSTTTPPVTTTSTSTSTTMVPETTTTTKPIESYVPFLWGDGGASVGLVYEGRISEASIGYWADLVLIGIIAYPDEAYRDADGNTLLPAYLGRSPVTGEGAELLIKIEPGDRAVQIVRTASTSGKLWIDPTVGLVTNIIDERMSAEEFLDWLREFPDWIRPMCLIVAFDTPDGCDSHPPCQEYYLWLETQLGFNIQLTQFLKGETTSLPEGSIVPLMFFRGNPYRGSMNP